MKAVVLVILLIIAITFLGNIKTVCAEFVEAGVQKVEKPVDVTDFDAEGFRSERDLIEGVQGKNGLFKLFSSLLHSL